MEIFMKSTITKDIKATKKLVWNVITNNQDYEWRSDISKIEIIDDNHFVEYTKTQFPTYFTILKKEKEKEYQFYLENKNMKGIWTGMIKEKENGVIELSFTEDLEISHFVMRLLAKLYVRKQQQTYMRDLEIKMKEMIKDK